jgi:hypothetical protein
MSAWRSAFISSACFRHLRELCVPGVFGRGPVAQAGDGAGRRRCRGRVRVGTSAALVPHRRRLLAHRPHHQLLVGLPLAITHNT